MQVIRSPYIYIYEYILNYIVTLAKGILGLKSFGLVMFLKRMMDATILLSGNLLIS